MDKFKIIDIASPFFEFDKTEGTINWSKVPLEKLYPNLKKYRSEFFQKAEAYIQKIKEIGYNAVTIDDLVNIVNQEFYLDGDQERLLFYENFFRGFFQLLKKYQLKIFITSDFIFSNDQIEKYKTDNNLDDFALFQKYIQDLFKKYPKIDGLIMRFGEVDGTHFDVRFRTRLGIKTPEELNKLIKELLPTFENDNKHLIVRTWSVGAYKIGDLMWNKETFHKAFEGIDSDFFIISLKYGETDFMRCLEVSDLIFATKHNKIIEFQARREYEGFGELSNTVAWEYQKYIQRLKHNSSVVGVQVWSQTGGWTHFNNLTYGENSSIWNELNVFTISKLTEGKGLKTIFKDFLKLNNKDIDIEKFIDYLKVVDNATNQIIYFGYEKIQIARYFRRVRITPLLSPYWDTIIVNPIVKEILLFQNVDPEQSLLEAKHALRKLRDWKNFAKKIDTKIDFTLDTYELIIQSRKVMFSDKRDQTNLNDKFLTYFEKYKSKYSKSYDVDIMVDSNIIISILIKAFLPIFIRENKRYRFVDKIFLSPIVAGIILRMIKILSKNLPQKTSTAMSFNVLFK